MVLRWLSRIATGKEFLTISANGFRGGYSTALDRLRHERPGHEGMTMRAVVLAVSEGLQSSDFDGLRPGPSATTSTSTGLSAASSGNGQQRS